MVKEYKIIWDKEALSQLKEAYEYIRRDSLQNAQKVRSKIFQKTSTLNHNPFRYQADKLRMDNDKSFRAFELYHYRVAYHIDETSKEVTILRVRNTNQEPLGY